MLWGQGSAVSSAAIPGGRSPAAKRILVHFNVKNEIFHHTKHVIQTFIHRKDGNSRKKTEL